MLQADRHFLAFSMEKPAGRNHSWVCCLSAHTVPWQSSEDLCLELSLCGTSTANQASSTISCILLSWLDLSGQGLLALPRTHWQGSTSSSGTIVSPVGNCSACIRSPTHQHCEHLRDISRPLQPNSSASETATGSKTGQLACIILNYHESSSIPAFLPLLPPELRSLTNQNRNVIIQCQLPGRIKIKGGSVCLQYKQIGAIDGILIMQWLD